MKWLRTTKPAPRNFGTSAASDIDHRLGVSLAVDGHGYTWQLVEGRGKPLSAAMAIGDMREILQTELYAPGQSSPIALEMTIIEAEAFVDALVSGQDAPATSYDKVTTDIYTAIQADVQMAATALSVSAEPVEEIGAVKG